MCTAAVHVDTALFYRRERTFGDNDIKYHIPNVKLDRTKNSIIFQGPKLWNSINTNLKTKKVWRLLKKQPKMFYSIYMKMLMTDQL